jgi:hypothetical protein
LHFHDLRHEAACHLYEWTTRLDVLIAKITGHIDIRMLRRYSSLRGSGLVDTSGGRYSNSRIAKGWDEVELAIRWRRLSLSPKADLTQIRLIMPPTTQARRITTTF